MGLVYNKSMMNNECNNKQLSTTYIGQIPVDTLDSTPDYVLTERDVEDPNTGKIIRSMTRTPGAKLFGGGSFDNIAVIDPNNTIEVPEGQVIAGKIVNNGSYNTVEVAEDSADFLIVGNLGTMLKIQNTGFVYIPNGHQYIVGAQYYTGEDGFPTTNSASGFKLFKPISQTQLAINLGA